MTRRPLIVRLHRDPTPSDAQRLRPCARVAGVADDFAGPPGTLVAVIGPSDVARSIDAALRGWDLVIRLDLAGEALRLALEDLDRIGQLSDESALERGPLLDPVDESLLDGLAAGSTLRDAARASGVSTRTAARRLASLRAALGIPTTAGLVACCRG